MAWCFTRNCALDIAPDGEAWHVSCFAFHPTLPVVAVAVGTRVTVYDVTSGEVAVRGVVQTLLPVTLLSVSQLHIAAGDNAGSIYAWDFNTFESVLELVHTQQEEKALASIALSPSKPLILYSRVSSKTIYIQEISSLGKPKAAQRLDCKRAITAMAIHPSEPLVALFCNGILVVFDYVTRAQLCQSDELLKTSQSSLGGRTFISIGANGTHIAVASEKGLLACFNCEQHKLSFVAKSHTTAVERLVTDIAFHPSLKVFYVLSSDGLVLARGLDCEVSKDHCSELITELETVERDLQSSKNNQRNPSQLKVAGLTLHSRYNLAAFAFDSPGGDLVRQQHILYSVIDKRHPCRGTPLAAVGLRTFGENLEHFLHPEGVCKDKLFYLENGFILKQTVHSGAIAALCALPASSVDGSPIHPIRLLVGDTKLVVVFESVKMPEGARLFSPKRNTTGFYATVDLTHNSDAVPEAKPMGDVSVRFGSKDGLPPFLLSADGQQIQVEGESPSELPCALHRIFPAPSVDGQEAIIGVTREKLVKAVAPFKELDSRMLRLYPYERVCTLNWNLVHVSVSSQSYVCAVMTTHRILIVTSDLEVVACVKASCLSPHVRTFHGTFWVGTSLLFTTDSHVRYLTISGLCQNLVELSAPDAAVVGVWNDRLILASYELSVLRLHSQAIGLLEPLLFGELSASGRFGREPKLNEEHVAKLMRTFDTTRVSIALIAHLENDGYFDAAFALSKNSHVISKTRKFTQAAESRRLQSAYQLLLDMSQCPPSDVTEEKLAAMYRSLAVTARQYGQWQLAFDCYAALDDVPAIMSILSVTGQGAQAEALAKQLREQPNRVSMLAACKRLLKSKAMHSRPGAEGGKLKDFAFQRKNVSLTPSPCVLSYLTDGVSPIKNLEFLDSLPRWFPVELNDVLDHAFQHKEAAVTMNETSIGIPSDLGKVVPLLVTRLTSAKELTEASNFKGEIPRSLAPPQAQKLLVRREGYSLSNSSAIGKNASTRSGEGTDATEVTYNSDEDNDDSEAPVTGSEAEESCQPSMRNMSTGDIPTAADDSDSDAEVFESDEESVSEELIDSDEDYDEDESDEEIEEIVLDDDTDYGIREPVADVLEAAPGAEIVSIVDANPVRTPSAMLIPPKQRKKGSLNQSAIDPLDAPPGPDPLSLVPGESDPLEDPLNSIPGNDGHLDPLATARGIEEPVRAVEPIDDAKPRDCLESIPPPLASAASTPAIASTSAVPPRPPRTRTHHSLSCSEPDNRLKAKRSQDTKNRRWNSFRGNEGATESGINPKVVEAKKRLERAIENLEEGLFNTAQVYAEQSITLLNEATPGGSRREVKLCVAYKRSLQILMQVKLMDAIGSAAEQRIARLCNILATMPVMPVHRLAFIALAAEKNFIAENYGTASGLLSIMNARGLLDKAQVEQMLADCERLEYTNAEPFNKSNVLCFVTNEPITGAHLYCTFCNSSFSLEALRAEETCSMCLSGVLERKHVPSQDWSS